ncbi:MAG: NAD(P)H-dependent oxidoreductase subunit E, partial [Lentisphaeria bacterium]
MNIPEGDDTSEDGLFTLSKVACLGCCMLAVAVQIDNHIFGHVTSENIPKILKDFLLLAQDDSVAAPSEIAHENKGEVRICRCSSCRAAGSAKIYDAFVKERNNRNFDFTVKEVSCHGMSYLAPLVSVATKNLVYHYDCVRLITIKSIISRHFTASNLIQKISWKGKNILDAFYQRKSCNCAKEAIIPNDLEKLRLITTNSGITNPESLSDYQNFGGFVAFNKVLHMQPQAVISLLTSSKLLGRGGGGFPTGEKWRMAFEAAGDAKVVICNADEGDPGAFMDRMLLESYPYRVLEGIMIAAAVIKAKCAIIYIREEYTQAVEVLERVISKLRNQNCFAPLDPNFDIILFRGAGAFVCGEETALIESIEGKRGIPRKRPPFP